MKFSNTVEGNIELMSAIAKIKEVARLIEMDCYDRDTKFQIAWDLCFKHLQKLESYRYPN